MIERIGKLCHVIHIHKHLDKHMMQNSKKGLLLFGFGVVFLNNNVLGHLWREITLRRDSLKYVMLCGRPDICFVVGIMSGY